MRTYVADDSEPSATISGIALGQPPHLEVPISLTRRNDRFCNRIGDLGVGVRLRVGLFGGGGTVGIGAAESGFHDVQGSAEPDPFGTRGGVDA